MYSDNFIKNRATCPLVPCNGRRERFHTSIFDIYVIDIRYSQFSTDYFANDDNLQYNFFGSGSSGLGGFFMSNQFEPKLVAFLCNWCSYAGADLAGVSRFQYPPNIRVVRVMCTGRIDPVLILEALTRGIDGVLIGG